MSTSHRPSSSSASPPNKLGAIVHSQRQTLRLFLSHPPTRTPVIVLYVASFGGALHAAVTTYFYLAIGANEMEIGRLGFIMSVGALAGAPLSGAALDRYGPWVPIVVTAGACAWGCLWRGVAGSLASLRAGAILLGVGVNMWTAVLGHLVKSFPPSMRSEVLSGFGVQTTVIQLAGKGVFPLVEYTLHRLIGLEDSLLRYRIHMGMCSFFCIYGWFALFVDRKNVKGAEKARVGVENDAGSKMNIAAAIKYQQKHSDVDEFLDEDVPGLNSQHSTESTEIELASMSVTQEVISSSLMPSDGESYSSSSASIDPDTTIAKNSDKAQRRRHLLTTATLTFALLLQSIATTIFTIIWPLMSKERFDLSAHTFGIMLWISSVVSTGAVASFPTIERSEIIGGRVRCAAWGFGLSSLCCLVFCFCSFSDYWTDVDIIGSEIVDSSIITLESDKSRILEHHGTVHQLHSRKQIGLHALAAMALQACLCFLEPSLKSILSLVVNSPTGKGSTGSQSLGSTIGGMMSLGSIGGMAGNLAGTWLYKFSKDAVPNESDGHRWQSIFEGGSLPFIVSGFLLAVSSMLIGRLDEPTTLLARESNRVTKTGEYRNVGDTDVESGHPVCTAEEGSESERPDGCCLALRETTYDLKLD